MKTILPSVSLVVIIATTLVLGGIYPPLSSVSAEMTAPKALESSKISETSNQPTEAETKPEATPARVLTPHQSLMQEAGIQESDWASAEQSINDESGWCATKWEGEIGYCPEYHGVPDYGGYGLCQSTPANKMASMGEGWETSELLQLKWCNQYAQQYGSWTAAMKFKYCTGYCYSPRTNTTEFKRTPWF